MWGGVYKLFGRVQLSSLHELLSYAGMGFGDTVIFESFLLFKNVSVSNPSTTKLVHQLWWYLYFDLVSISNVG